MTNIPSGSKRSWEGNEPPSKRAREKEDARDWKDVHLNSPKRRDDRRRADNRDDYRNGHRRSREPDHHRRPSDYTRDRERRDDRDRDRNRDRDDSRKERTRENGRPDNSRRPSPSRRSAEPYSATPRADSEREEGEISPRPSPRPQTTSLPTEPPQVPEAKSVPQPEIELELPESEPSVEETLAARRARRLAIMAKYSSVNSSAASLASPSPGPSSAVDPPPSLPSVSDTISQPHSAIENPVSAPWTENPNGMISNGKRESLSASPTPAAFSLAKEGEEEGQVNNASREDNNEQISAADYDPNLDYREDEHKRARTVVDGPQDVEMVEEEEEAEEDEDVDDMFAVVTAEKKVKKVKKVRKPAAPALITTNLDSAADPEGYYQIILGEQLDGGRYQVFSSLGKGMFANVVRARVLHGEIGDAGKEVAIKIVRSQESMQRAGLKEVQILNKLKQADPEDKKHVVRLERTFEHRGHLCLVFESMSMNLREVVKRFGKDVGLNMKAVRAYAHQLFLAMSLLRKCNIMHADIKPDNILVNEQKTVLKLCDLGSASDASENAITPYLVSRFYRAPEIILGYPYDPSLDMWSIGCTLYELYTGKIMLPGHSNNHMLLLMMELKGRFNTKMIRKSQFGQTYFDELGAFISVEQDKITKTDVVKKVHITNPKRDLKARLMPPSSVKLKDDEMKSLLAFIDLLDKCTALDPAKRITPKEALSHPFIRG
ncbi:kinase-like domain-containing protein [Cristinia sonorae]|uniref:non-specific serine/threonine protein kinase n=1 Tax=Cristinia sonorae TaxID=1940300 RepID=A0A8K0XPS0_9AGAR|nr:kinase-like domain-containing protein [Cristinia sonorae]